DEQVHGVRQQRQPDHDLIGAGAEDQPHAGGGQHADGHRDERFHQADPRSASGEKPGWGVLRLNGLRTDWCASAIRISTVAPITTENTPMSKKKAVTIGIVPSSGSSTYS